MSATEEENSGSLDAANIGHEDESNLHDDTLTTEPIPSSNDAADSSVSTSPPPPQQQQENQDADSSHDSSASIPEEAYNDSSPSSSQPQTFTSLLHSLHSNFLLPHEKYIFPMLYSLFYFTFGLSGTNRSITARKASQPEWTHERFYNFHQQVQQYDLLHGTTYLSQENHAPTSTFIAHSAPPSATSSAASTPSTASKVPLLFQKTHSIFSLNALPSTMASLFSRMSPFKFISAGLHLIDNWMDFFFLIIMYIQLASHIFIPTLGWSKSTTRFLVRLQFFKSFQLETLLLDPIDFNQSPALSHNTALWFNFYGPLIGALVYLFALYGNVALCFILGLVHGKRPVEKFSGVRHWYMRLPFLSLHYLFRLLPLLYMPSLNAFLLAFTCNVGWYHRLETVPQNCWDIPHFLPALISIFSLLPFIGIALFGVSVNNDWRPDTKNVCGKPHTRYDLVTFQLCSLIAVMSVFPESLTIFVLFIDFTLIMILIGLHIYFMQWYKSVVNQMVCALLTVTMFGCMISLLVSVFHFLFDFFQYSFTDFPGSILYAAIAVSFVLGIILTNLRLHVIRLSLFPLTAPRPLQLLYNIEPSDIIIPRGEFEIEMASRSIPIVGDAMYENPQRVSERQRYWKKIVARAQLVEENRNSSLVRQNSLSSSTTTNGSTLRPGGIRVSPRPVVEDSSMEWPQHGQPNQSQPRLDSAHGGNCLEPSEEETYFNQLEECVRNMYQNALDVSSHSRSEYVHISFATFQAHVLNDLQQAMQLAENCRSDNTVLWPDFRLMFYVRQRYWAAMQRLKHQPVEQVLSMVDQGNIPCREDTPSSGSKQNFDQQSTSRESPHQQQGVLNLRELTQLHQRRAQEMTQEARRQRALSAQNEESSS